MVYENKKLLDGFLKALNVMKLNRNIRGYLLCLKLNN